MKIKKKFFKNINPIAWLLLTFLIIYCLSLVFMYSWGFITSLKTNSDFRRNMFGLPSGAPWQWQWKNYATAFNEMSMPVMKNNSIRIVTIVEMFFNSVLISVMSPLIGVFSTWIVAYIIAKFPCKFSSMIYTLNIVLMVVPIIGGLPSALQLYKAVGLYDTWGFVAFSSVGFVGQNLMIFYAFFRGIGKEYTEAAYVDGASNTAAMFKIVFPLSSQMFFVLFLMGFVAQWNDYMTMLIWMPTHPNLAYGIFRFTTSTTSAASWPPLQIAGCVMLAFPILILFLLSQDVMMKNLRVGGIKG